MCQMLMLAIQQNRYWIQNFLKRRQMLSCFKCNYLSIWKSFCKTNLTIYIILFEWHQIVFSWIDQTTDFFELDHIPWYKTMITFVYPMIDFENIRMYTFAMIVKSMANINHGYNIKIVIKDTKKKDKSSSISHNKLLT